MLYLMLLGPLIVQSTLSIATAIILISSLSFLGLGIKAPMPEWGSMLADSEITNEELSLPSYNTRCGYNHFCNGIELIGDGLRDALDPRLRD